MVLDRNEGEAKLAPSFQKIWQVPSSQWVTYLDYGSPNSCKHHQVSVLFACIEHLNLWVSYLWMESTSFWKLSWLLRHLGGLWSWFCLTWPSKPALYPLQPWPTWPPLLDQNSITIAIIRYIELEKKFNRKCQTWYIETQKKELDDLHQDSRTKLGKWFQRLSQAYSVFATIASKSSFGSQSYY